MELPATLDEFLDAIDAASGVSAIAYRNLTWINEVARRLVAAEDWTQITRFQQEQRITRAMVVGYWKYVAVKQSELQAQVRHGFEPPDDDEIKE